MIKGIVAFICLAVGLTVLVLASGYVEYRKRMNACIDHGGIVIKTSHGLKCVPRGEIHVL